MRNFVLTDWFYLSPTTLFPRRMRFAIGLLLVCLLGACAAEHPQSQPQLSQMRTNLSQKQYAQVVTQADAFLHEFPGSEEAAEALYLRGRAFEDRTSSNPAEARANQQSARQSYEQALLHRPERALEGYIRASLANVAYFQDDYTTASEQWLAAYSKLENNELKAWSLYRAGVAEQRLGRFGQADHTFQLVRQYFPGSEQARRAADRTGLRAFFVQVATFNDAANAGALQSELRAQGYAATIADASGDLRVVRIGPMSSYNDARQLQIRLNAKYHGTLIVP